jgi:3-methyladenine DNA glycosylase Tag
MKTVLIPIKKIKTGRKFFPPFNKKDFEYLVISVRMSGTIWELVVREKGDHYELLGGFDRFEAAKVVGLSEVPCRVISKKDTVAYNAFIDAELFKPRIDNKKFFELFEIKKDKMQPTPKTKPSKKPKGS